MAWSAIKHRVGLAVRAVEAYVDTHFFKLLAIGISMAILILFAVNAATERLPGHVATPPPYVAPIAQDCKATWDCHEFGACQLVQGRCRATSAQDCLASRDCANYRRCTLRNGVCEIEVATDQKCARTKNCAELGYCSMRKGVGCYLTSDEDCARTDDCRRHGDCTLIFTQDAEGERDESCGPGTTADCRKTDGCKRSGRCTWRGPGVGRGSCEK